MLLIKEKNARWAGLATFDCKIYDAERDALRNSYVGGENVKRVSFKRS